MCSVDNKIVQQQQQWSKAITNDCRIIIFSLCNRAQNSNLDVYTFNHALHAMSDYEYVAGGRLKLKGDAGIKKKKKKNKDKEKIIEKVNKGLEQEKCKEYHVPPTKAELAFMKQQEKLQKERILKIASTTHKKRVEEFNRHLDSLTEHFDIPKVSWTK